MTSYLELMARIREAPDRDDLRLEAADWFEAHGDAPRAEFIRLQLCHHSPVREQTPEHALAALTREEQALLDAHRERWLASLRDGTVWKRAYFRRGFLGEVQVTGPPDWDDAIWWTCRVLRLDREKCPSIDPRFLGLPSLRVVGPLSAAYLRDSGEAITGSRVRELVVASSGEGLEDEDRTAVLALPRSFPQLEELVLWDDRLCLDGDLAWLEGAELLTSLKRLQVFVGNHSSRIEPDRWAAVASRLPVSTRFIHQTPGSEVYWSLVHTRH